MKILLSCFLIFLFIVTESNLTYAEPSEIMIHVNELSEIKEVIQESNKTNFNLVVLSITIATIAVIATVVTAYYLKRQVQTMELDLESKSEPLLVITSLKPRQAFLKKGHVTSYDTWIDNENVKSQDLLKVSMSFTVENLGRGIARDIVKVTHIDENIFSKNIFENLNETDANMILAPNQEVRFTFNISGKRWFELEHKDLFAGLSIAYAGSKKRKYAGIVYGIRHGGNYIIESW